MESGRTSRSWVGQRQSISQAFSGAVPPAALSRDPSVASVVRRHQVGRLIHSASTAVRVGSNRVPLLDLAMDPGLLRALPDRRPWKYLAVCLAILLLHGSALVLAAVTMPLPSYRGDNVDYFVSVGWILFACGLVLFIFTNVSLIVLKHPFFELVLLSYFVSLLLLIAATVLHTSRLDASVTSLLGNPNGEARILSAQLSWLGNLVLYGYTLWVVRGSARATLKMPPREELEKYSLLLSIREMAMKKANMLEELAAQDRVRDERENHRREKQRQDDQAQAVWLAHKAQVSSPSAYISSDQSASPPALFSPSSAIGSYAPSANVFHTPTTSPAPPHDADMIQPATRRAMSVGGAVQQQLQLQQAPAHALQLHASGDPSCGLPSFRFITPQRPRTSDLVQLQLQPSEPMDLEADVPPHELQAAKEQSRHIEPEYSNTEPPSQFAINRAESRERPPLTVNRSVMRVSREEH
jgi:hypothetical protein